MHIYVAQLVWKMFVLLMLMLSFASNIERSLVCVCLWLLLLFIFLSKAKRDWARRFKELERVFSSMCGKLSWSMHTTTTTIHVVVLCAYHLARTLRKSNTNDHHRNKDRIYTRAMNYYKEDRYKHPLDRCIHALSINIIAVVIVVVDFILLPYLCVWAKEE